MARSTVKQLPPNTMAHLPAPRIVHYPDPAGPRRLVAYPARELAARRREHDLLYARWAERQAVIAEHDRRARRFLLGLGAVVGTAFLAVVAVVGWIVWHAIANVGLGALAVPVVILGLAGLVVGGHRCITVVQHWH